MRIYLNVDPELPASLVNFTSYVDAVPEPGVLARLHRAALLSESVRLQVVERMAHLAVTTPDDGWIQGPHWKVLLTPDDRTRLMDEVRDELVPRLESGYLWEGSERDEDDPLESALRGYEEAFEEQGDLETAEAFAQARDVYSQLPIRADDTDYSDRTPLTSTGLAPAPGTSRSIFDDIDVG